MFEKESIIELLEKIGSTLPVRVKIYMIGGGALSLKGLKEATKDVDLVLLDRKALHQIKGSFEKIGYKIDKGLFKEQFYKDAVFVFLDKSGSRIDILVDVVCGMLRLTKDMQKRAAKYGSFGNLDLYLVSNEDILLFKAVTDRPQDLIDIRALIDATKLDWDIIINECVAQHRKETRWIFWFYEQICRLEEQESFPIPEKNRVFEICLQNWEKKPSDWMHEFSIEQIRKYIPAKYLSQVQKK
ncbi:MAG: hypothetical protein KKC75_03770 [Nanoarchaeota archaeon]|nr:hypothetical protein [Nanoarchaeota archaeon]MBU1005647.1 hypothetical protein [Nanoarchaeota archaeon]MBU1945816.1 hypothetical protein [Nanoarchaeota archaeon]